MPICYKTKLLSSHWIIKISIFFILHILLYSDTLYTRANQKLSLVKKEFFLRSFCRMCHVKVGGIIDNSALCVLFGVKRKFPTRMIREFLSGKGCCRFLRDLSLSRHLKGLFALSCYFFRQPIFCWVLWFILNDFSSDLFEGYAMMLADCVAKCL